MIRRYGLIWLCMCLATAGLFACSGRQPELPPLPEGVQTMTGILQRADISLLRRGTHILDDGHSRTYVESASINLRPHENKRVTITGTLERNTDPNDLPVIVVVTIESEQTEPERVSLPQYGLTLSVPEGWVVSEQEDDVLLSESASGSAIVSIFLDTEPDLPDESLQIIVDNYAALRVFDGETGRESVYIDTAVGTVHLLFDVTAATDSTVAKSQWLSFLGSMQIRKPTETTTSTSSGSTTIPCGGAAGVLCPTGYFCNVTNLEENIGHCQKLQ